MSNVYVRNNKGLFDYMKVIHVTNVLRKVLYYKQLSFELVWYKMCNMVLTVVLGTFPRLTTFLLAFSLAMRILCLGAMVCV